MTPNFAEIVQAFQFKGRFSRVDPFMFGHINDTYIAWYNSDLASHRYILQRINHEVFTQPEMLMQNVEAVTQHLRQKIITGRGDAERETLNLVRTTDGDAFHKAPDGNYWRAYLFIEGARTYEIVEDLDHVYSAAWAFGNFQGLLADFPVRHLHETIPNFHHTPKRFDAFVQAVEQDVENRAQAVRAEIEFVEQRAKETSILVDLLDKGELPLRVTHNDTKFNNVLIDDETGEGICVVDLDTVMPGLSLYDFGDAIRSSATPAAEDESDLSKVRFDLGIFARFAHGYLDAVGDLLEPLEIEHLPFSARLMTFECGMRFLTDYVNGDVYFRVHRDSHNLDRCRTQFKMVQDMEENFDQMVNLVQRYSR